MNLLEDNKAKSRISEGCFFAIGSCARFELVKVHQEHDYGTDYELKKLHIRNGKIRSLATVLDFQLKATKNWELEDDYIKYNLETKAYNDIVSRNIEKSTPLLLILLCLPENHDEWIEVEKGSIIFRENMYWYHTDSTTLLANDDSTKTIRIPRTNSLNVEAFTAVVNEYATKVEE